MSVRRPGRETVLFAGSTALLALGGTAWVAGSRDLADVGWALATLLGLGWSVAWTIEALRRRQPTVDVIAVLALAGALVVGEAFAGATIAVMLASGRLLEVRAAARARRDLSLLTSRSPRRARRRAGDLIMDIPVAAVQPADILVVSAGEVVPVDGRLLGAAVLDESSLTGEDLPRSRIAGEDVRSGVVNVGGLVELVATATAEGSTYAGVVRLVEQAQAASAPFVRTADRFAVLFVPLTVALAALAWLLSGDPVRAVAVLVVATPCPLLLAAPIALMSGLSRAARSGVVIKGGGALEKLAAGTVILFDKTGTLTQGRPELTGVVAAGDRWSGEEVLRLAASLDQVSSHVLAGAIVTAATRRGLVLEMPTDVEELHGYGLQGRVGGQLVRIGKASWIAGDDLPAWVRQVRRRADLEGSLNVLVAVDGAPAGAFLLADAIRPEAPRMIRALRAAGIGRVMLVTGDRADTAESVGRIVGVDVVLSNCDPERKLEVVRCESAIAATIMVGDGINDAPALAAAGAGVALAARGATASSESADVVLTVDRIDALADAILIARRAKAIALQAVLVGMGLSLVAMVAASCGLLPPAVGAVTQEAIDVLAIGLALRAVRPGPAHTIALSAADVSAGRALRGEHDAVLSTVERIRSVADGLSGPQSSLAACRRLLVELETALLPHERAEDALLLPLVARALGGAETTAALRRTHAEIEHQVGRLRRQLDGIQTELVPEEDLVDLRRLLYGLYGVLRLHNAMEEETAFSLIPTAMSNP